MYAVFVVNYGYFVVIYFVGIVWMEGGFGVVMYEFIELFICLVFDIGVDFAVMILI